MRQCDADGLRGGKRSKQTMVALARALAREARVLVLDETTAALTDTETEQLFTVLRSLRDHGAAI